MAKGKRTKTKDLIAELIQNELEANLAKMVRKARKKASRETDKLNELLRLEYHRNSGFVEAEVIADTQPDEIVKKTEDSHNGERQQ